MSKLDILALAAHPDDVELSCSGTLAKHIAMGKRVGIVDFTKGELGTRGTPELRMEEAEEASRILGLSYRFNLGFRDGFFQINEEHLVALIQQIRHTQPEVVLCNAPTDRHCDHGRAAQLAKEACFLAGLRKISSSWQGQEQAAWRPHAVYHYIQDYHLSPDFVIDITPYMSIKQASILAYRSQFYQANQTDNEPQTPISSKDFLDFVQSRAREMGRPIGVTYAEGFLKNRPLGISNLLEVQ